MSMRNTSNILKQRDTPDPYGSGDFCCTVLCNFSSLIEGREENDQCTETASAGLSGVLYGSGGWDLGTAVQEWDRIIINEQERVWSKQIK